MRKLLLTSVVAIAIGATSSQAMASTYSVKATSNMNNSYAEYMCRTKNPASAATQKTKFLSQVPNASVYRNTTHKHYTPVRDQLWFGSYASENALKTARSRFVSWAERDFDTAIRTGEFTSWLMKRCKDMGITFSGGGSGVAPNPGGGAAGGGSASGGGTGVVPNPGGGVGCASGDFTSPTYSGIVAQFRQHMQSITRGSACAPTLSRIRSALTSGGVRISVAPNGRLGYHSNNIPTGAKICGYKWPAPATKALRDLTSAANNYTCPRFGGGGGSTGGGTGDAGGTGGGTGGGGSNGGGAECHTYDAKNTTQAVSKASAVVGASRFSSNLATCNQQKSSVVNGIRNMTVLNTPGINWRTYGIVTRGTPLHIKLCNFPSSSSTRSALNALASEVDRTACADATDGGGGNGGDAKRPQITDAQVVCDAKVGNASIGRLTTCKTNVRYFHPLKNRYITTVASTVQWYGKPVYSPAASACSRRALDSAYNKIRNSSIFLKQLDSSGAAEAYRVTAQASGSSGQIYTGDCTAAGSMRLTTYTKSF